VEERFAEAATRFREALAHAPDASQIRGRIEQNLGSVRGSQGDRAGALAHYERSLAAFVSAGDDHSSAIAHHNLGVVNQERGKWIDAEAHFQLAFAAADRTGDTHLKGLVLLSRSEVLVALGRLTQARLTAETAAGIFDELRASAELGDAYRVLGVILRNSGNLKLAQARLRLAVELSADAGSAVGEAEALRDLAVTRALAGETDGVTNLLVRASRTLGRLQPCLEPDEVLEGNYPPAVRVWADWLRASAPGAAEQAERVAAGAASLARVAGRDPRSQAVIRLAGYLQAVSPSLIEAAELPWEVSESRLPFMDRQMIQLVARHAYDTTPPPEGGGLSTPEALRRLESDRDGWHPEVYSAFLQSQAA
jgi:tetratricopeptide (TPR) repeat protein